jgi:hypothetical protein
VTRRDQHDVTVCRSSKVQPFKRRGPTRSMEEIVSSPDTGLTRNVRKRGTHVVGKETHAAPAGRMKHEEVWWSTGASSQFSVQLEPNQDHGSRHVLSGGVRTRPRRKTSTFIRGQNSI